MDVRQPQLVLGTMWAESYPQVAASLGDKFTVHVFDLFNAEMSIENLKGTTTNALIMFADMLDALGPLVVDLGTSGVSIQHVIVASESPNLLDAQRHDELGICGSFSSTLTADEVATFVQQILDTCPCEPGESRLAQKIKTRSAALLAIESDAVDLAITSLVAEGCSNEEIADKLHYSHQTIRNRLSEILKQTASSNRTELAVTWRRHLMERRLKSTRE